MSSPGEQEDTARSTRHSAARHPTLPSTVMCDDGLPGLFLRPFAACLSWLADQLRPAVRSWDATIGPTLVPTGVWPTRSLCWMRRGLPLVVVTVLVCLTTAGVVSSVSSPPVPQPEPGVNKTYNGTFRILASNDADPYYNTTTIQVPDYADNGSVTVVNKTVGTLPFRLQGVKTKGNLWPTQTLETALMTDAYFTGLRGGIKRVPHRDSWRSLKHYREERRVEDIRFIRLNRVTHGEATSTEGNFRVEILHSGGFWLPVYRANVTSTEHGYAVANPADALVLSSKEQTVIKRRIEGLDALLRYSALADSNREAQDKAAIPMHNGEELFPAEDGGPAPLVWRNRSATIVKDAYIGILDVPPAVWYRTRYITQTEQVTGYVPWDYRTEAPADYSARASCSIKHTQVTPPTDNNSTHRHSDSVTRTYPKTNWADYRLGSTEERINVTIHNETYSEDMSRLGGKAGVWSTYYDGDRTPLAPGNYTLRANLTISYTLYRHYGVDSATCPTWQKRDTVTRTVTRTYSVPVRTIESDSPGLSIAATVYDKPGNDVLALNWTGDQRLTRNPWRRVTVSIGNKTLIVTSPWKFYSVGQTTAVEERSDSGTRSVPASHSFGGRYPTVLRTRASVTNVTVRLSELASQRSWWQKTHTIPTERVAQTSLPDTVIAPGNPKPTYLYDVYAGVYLSNGDAVGEPVSMTAVTPFNAPIEQTSVEVVRYHHASLDIWLNESNGSTRVAMQLTAAATGDPLANRTLHLQGMNQTTVTTSASGMAYAKPTKTLVRARFTGDDWNHSHTTYYLSDVDGLATGHGFIGAAESVFGYIDLAISNVVVLAEWLGLGIFAFWWARVRSPPP